METKLLLRNFLKDKNYFTIDFINQRAMSFTDGKTEARNKLPKQLQLDQISSCGNKLPLSG